MNLSQRSYKKELLDRSDIPFEDIKRNMEELNFINTYLGGHSITLAGLKTLLRKRSIDEQTEFTVCEVGCGGGDNMIAIQNWSKRNNITVRFVGIDINANCIEVAVSKFNGANASFITSDYIKVKFGETKPDYIFSSLFCHHFTNDELIEMLGWMSSNARRGFFINDLHRHNLAYHSIKLLTKFFSRSYLVKNDAPLSVLRGFTKNEWINLLKAANIGRYIIEWRWAFRYLIIVRNNNFYNEQLS